MRQFERYARADIAIIGDICRADYQTFKRAALVCMLSARRQFDSVGAAVRDVEAARAKELYSQWPSAAQKRGIAWLESDHGIELWRILSKREISPVEALARATECPALGLAKGGFLCQMMGFDVGCLDTHNVDKYALGRDAIRLRKDRPSTVLRSINAYARLCQRLGGSAVLWGAWCEYVAELYPDTYKDGRAVSALHVAYVEGIPF